VYLCADFSKIVHGNANHPALSFFSLNHSYLMLGRLCLSRHVAEDIKGVEYLQGSNYRGAYYVLHHAPLQIFPSCVQIFNNLQYHSTPVWYLFLHSRSWRLTHIIVDKKLILIVLHH